MRSDKKKSLGKVAKAAMNNPLASQREIAEQANVWLWTANRIIQELEQTGTKDHRIIAITDTDLSILTAGQLEIEKRLSDKEELSKMRTVEISSVIKDSTARYALFRGTATDKDGGLKESGFKGLSTAELSALLED